MKSVQIPKFQSKDLVVRPIHNDQYPQLPHTIPDQRRFARCTSSQRRRRRKQMTSTSTSGPLSARLRTGTYKDPLSATGMCKANLGVYPLEPLRQTFGLPSSSGGEQLCRAYANSYIPPSWPSLESRSLKVGGWGARLLSSRDGQRSGGLELPGNIVPQ